MVPMTPFGMLITRFGFVTRDCFQHGMTQARYRSSIGVLIWVLVCMNTHHPLGESIIGTPDQRLEDISRPI